MVQVAERVSGWRGPVTGRERAPAPDLIRVATVCLGIIVLGGLPLALVSAGWLHVDAAAVDAMNFLHNISGQFGGPGTSHCSPSWSAS